MICKAEEKDKQEVYRMWKTIFAFDDGGYTDYYFKHLYRNEDTFITKLENEVVACCSKHKHTVMLHGHLIQCSMILAMAVKGKYRHQGMMHQMMDVLIDEIEHQELITMIQAYNPSLYEPFGFKTIYKRRRWTIKRNEVKRFKPNVTKEVYAMDMLKLYGQFVSRFNGYVVLDLKYFEMLFKEVEAEGGIIIGMYQKQLEGYALLYSENKKVVIRECLYLNSRALMQMVNYALSLSNEIILETSNAENLMKLFPSSSFEEMDYTMVRLNNPQLFNRLYNCQVSTVEEAMTLKNLPLYMHENR